MWPFGRWKRLKRGMRRLWRLGDSRMSIDLEELMEVAESNPTKKYVNLLLLAMTRNDVREVVLGSARPLPPLKIHPDAEIPPFESVVNRLKVMATLDPVIYQHPREGRIELTIGSDPVAVYVRFVDAGPERSVYLRMEWLDKPPPPAKLG